MESWRESITVMSRSGVMSRATTAALYVPLTSPLTQKQTTASAPASNAAW